MGGGPHVYPSAHRLRVFRLCARSLFASRAPFRQSGWQLSREIDTTLTLAALDHALAQRCPLPGLIHHSDRGVQYASHAYVAHLEEAGAQVSMSAVGNPYHNAKAESFFKTLKHEETVIAGSHSWSTSGEYGLPGLVFSLGGCHERHVDCHDLCAA